MTDRPKLTIVKEETEKKEDQGYDFEEQQRLNKEKQERLRKERESANKSVKRSYRLNGKDKKK